MYCKKELYGKLTYLEKHGWGPIQAAQRFLKRLITIEKISIRKGHDRSGNELFYVCDHTTDQHHVFFSEADLRVWINQRYYSDARSPNLVPSCHRQLWLK